MSAQDNKAIVRRLLEEGYGGGNLAVADEIIAPGSLHYDDFMPEPVRGPEGLREVIKGYRSAFPDLSITVDEQIGEGDKVSTRWTARGTHKGDLMGIAPTGKQATTGGIILHRLEGGKIVEGRVSWDSYGMLQQLGAVPAAARA